MDQVILLQAIHEQLKSPMQSASVEQGCSSACGAPGGSVVQVCFPSVRAAVLDSLNRQREEGRLCDLSIQVQGQVFRAHRCVLAASSPYFHDQVLLKDMSTVSIPAVMDPLAFESVLSCAYTGQLRMLRDDIVNYLTVGSVLQMWHIVDKCTELLKEGRGGGGGQPAGGGAQGHPSSSGGPGGGVAQPGDAHSGPPSRPSLSESQSPSSTNYFSPREAGFGGGGGGAGGGASGGAGEGGLNSTPSYCTPSGGEESFLIEDEEQEEEEEDEEEEELLLYPRKRERGSGRRKKAASVPEQEAGVSDSFGVSSYQGGDPLPPLKRPTYSQPSIMPRKQWVVVKTERAQDEELIVVSGEEGGEEEEEEERERERERERDRDRDRQRERTFSISDVRTLSAELSSRAEAEMQVDYCQSSEDYLKFDSGLVDQAPPQHPHHSTSGSSAGAASRSAPALLGPAQNSGPRAQLFPIDMQGNQILLYSQASLDGSPSMGASSLKGLGLEHGAVHLSGHGGSGLDGPEGAGGGALGKVFMCHCGKTFTHKSMRDRHINMHLDLRPFHCPVCAKKFKMKHHLTEHMKTHTGLKPYDCQGCGKKFMWRDSFVRHRSHCERHEGAAVVSPPHPHPHPHQQHLNSDLSQSGVAGRSGVSVLSPPHHPGGGGAGLPGLTLAGPGGLLGVSQQGAAHGLGPAGLGLGGAHGSCSDDVCEVSVSESSIT
ncbi:zinc finger and BTB domain-containing protein 22b isoform X1 [Conger conger]|uniref:zinc finger and BTB domain-containing protein 22b isoform X1 n=2 Tax=Conger conger TaxID=82655 RepID=UPI002A5AF40F|nr:zinc finger and BTB domain-containing protein 22b isoform X1 [Conger conger]